MLAVGTNPVSLLPPLQRDLGPARRGAASCARARAVDAELFALIEERRRDGAQRDDVLSLLLAARHEDGSPMSAQELRDELMTLLVAGHETTASQLAFAFERLVRTPDVLARLTEAVAGDDGDAYVTATVQETLRRRPVLPNAAPRLVMEEIESAGGAIPPGCAWSPTPTSSTTIRRSTPIPYAFRPERFLEQSPGTYTWIPFGGGRRRCLGAAFAHRRDEGRPARRPRARAPRVAGDGRLELSRRRSITLSPREGAEVVLV